MPRDIFAGIFGREEYKMQVLRNDVGYFTERGGTIGWYLGKDGVVVVDTQFPDQAVHLIEERNISDETLRQVRAALKFLYAMTLRRSVEVAYLPARRRSRPLPMVLSGTEVTALFQAVESEPYRLVLTAMYASGLRISEACRLRPEDIGLYLFLALAADKNGLSCWRLDRIEREIPSFDRHALWNARDRLVQLELIAYRPWRKVDPDGCYQVLAVGRPKDNLPSELEAAIEQVRRHVAR